ncbi:MAG: class I SAM-dependent methyltransferase [Candidatus Bipolaricaulia bacterium]
MYRKFLRRIYRFLGKIGITSKITGKNIEPFVKKYGNNGKTLDIGCGRGPYSQYFPNRVGIDIIKTPAVDIVADAHDLRMFQDEEFDCILCTEVLEHLHTPQKAINEMQRVLKKNGGLILTTRFLFPLHNIPDDYYRFTKYGLKHLLNNFEIIEMREEVNTLGTIAVLFQRIGFQCETLYFKPFRLFWLLLAKLVDLFSFIITEGYGEVENKTKIKNIMTSGYYVACRKVR